MDADGHGYTSDAAEAIVYAVDQGARVINASYGSTTPTDVERDAIAYAAAHDTLIVAAAGNDHTNDDKQPIYPATYPDANIVTVAATNEKDQLADFSNYGKKTVDLAAPGDSIGSTCGERGLPLPVRHEHRRPAGGRGSRDAAQAQVRSGQDDPQAGCSTTSTTRTSWPTGSPAAASERPPRARRPRLAAASSDRDRLGVTGMPVGRVLVLPRRCCPSRSPSPTGVRVDDQDDDDEPHRHHPPRGVEPPVDRCAGEVSAAGGTSAV